MAGYRKLGRPTDQRKAMLRKDVCCIFCKKEVSLNIYSRNHKKHCRWGEK